MAEKKPEVVKDAVKVERFSRSLRITLKPEEIAQRADRAAHIVAQRDQKEDDRKAANTAAKSQIEELSAELGRISSEVRDKATFAPVDCERRFDWRQRRVFEVRTDTEETIHERAMSVEETQLLLDLEDEADDEAHVEPPSTAGKKAAPKPKKSKKPAGAPAFD